MAFTINHPLERLPTFPLLCRLAEKHNVLLTGGDRAGSFARDGVAGNYEFGEAGVWGNFAAHGVKGNFALGTGQATITIEDKPFWLPETLLKQKITEGLESLLKEPC
jgi:hypothetical protein